LIGVRGLKVEFVVDRALRLHDRSEFTLSTKVGRRLRPNCRTASTPDRLPFDVFYDYTYDGVMRSFEDSLQRLGLCRIDIAYIHDVNPRWQGSDYERRFAEAMDGAYPALAENTHLASAQFTAVTVALGRHNMPHFAPQPELGGFEAFVTLHLDDRQIAAVVNYVRSHFGNHYSDEVTPADIAALHP